MSQLGSWATQEWSFPIWLRVLGVSRVSLPGRMGTRSLAPSGSGKTGTQREKGPWAQICTQARQQNSICSSILFFHSHMLLGKGQSSLRQLAEQHMNPYQKGCTQLLLQWRCDSFGQAIPIPLSCNADPHSWVNRCGQREVMGGGRVACGYGVTTLLLVKLWRDRS